jgi:hypothetical protein
MLYRLFRRAMAYACAIALVAAAAPSLGEPALRAIGDKNAIIGLYEALHATAPNAIRRTAWPAQAAASLRR